MTYKVKRLCHTSFLLHGLSLHSSQRKGQRVFLGSCSVKCKLSLTGRGQAEGLTGEPSIQRMEVGVVGRNRESFSLHCVSITLKRKLIHSALNCMPRPSMCLPLRLHTMWRRQYLNRLPKIPISNGVMSF